MFFKKRSKEKIEQELKEINKERLDLTKEIMVKEKIQNFSHDMIHMVRETKEVFNKWYSDYDNKYDVEDEEYINKMIEESKECFNSFFDIVEKKFEKEDIPFVMEMVMVHFIDGLDDIHDRAEYKLSESRDVVDFINYKRDKLGKQNRKLLKELEKY